MKNRLPYWRRAVMTGTLLEQAAVNMYSRYILCKQTLQNIWHCSYETGAVKSCNSNCIQHYNCTVCLGDLFLNGPNTSEGPT